MEDHLGVFGIQTEAGSYFGLERIGRSAVLKLTCFLLSSNLVVQNMGSQMGGEVTDYEKGLKFVTFHGSGHMVPQFRPQAALHFLKKLVEGQDLSPLMPNNVTLKALSDTDFKVVADGWTETAMRSPYVDCDVEDSSKAFGLRGEHVSSALN